MAISGREINFERRYGRSPGSVSYQPLPRSGSSPVWYDAGVPHPIRLPRASGRALALGIFSALIAGCGGESDEDDDDREMQVDYVVLGVSGHCFSNCPAEYNPEYLASAGTLERIASNLPDTSDGEVPYGGYADSYYSWEDGRGEILAFGFLQLVSDLEYLRDEWGASLDGKRRIAMACHSHGCVWAHIALFVVEDVEVEVLIDLDAESIGWESDDWSLGFGDEWAEVIEDDGRRWPFDIACAGNCWEVPGVASVQDIEDIVPPSVGEDLEVASLDTTFIQDAEPNHRADGGTSGITRREFDLAHEDVDDRSSTAMDWVVEQLPSSP